MYAEPLAIAVTTPELFTVTLAVLLLLHVPPGSGSLNVALEPTHIVILEGLPLKELFTVTVFVTRQPPPIV